MDDKASKFNINIVRDLYVHGDPVHTALVRNLIKGYYFLNTRDFGALKSTQREDTFFVVASVDFSNMPKMQETARIMSDISSPLAHRVIFAVAPDELASEQLLFAQELGVRYVASGVSRSDDLKAYLKRICLETHQVGSLVAMEEDLGVAMRAADKVGVEKTMTRLAAIPYESEDVTRLLAVGNMHAGNLRRAETFLKKLLQINPQNLWAANTIGKIYLRSGRAADGITILAKLSQFHELNSERLLTLGNAYVQAGMTSEATQSFNKGSALIGTPDDRFQEGKAKVRLAERDFTGAFALLGGKSFSEDVISFLNLRAIMSIRSGRFEEGVEYYEHAYAGAGESKDRKARLKFNLGLAYARHGELDKAQKCLAESCSLGGQKFQRAKAPLDVVQNVMKNHGKARSTPKESAAMLEESEWETLF